ncbi:MAG: potassium transporter TrkA [Chloroflexales bacterium]|nr:potassium transporter TrkA [Chloroflexales bacterium]
MTTISSDIPGAAPRPTASEDEIRLERLRQRRRSYRLWRLLRANLRDIGILGRQAWVSLASLAALLVGSALYLYLVYFPRVCAASGVRCGPDGDLAASFYHTMLLLVFNAQSDFPQDLSGRLIFFGVPLFGLFFLLQSVVDFARLLFDKGARREGWQISLASTFSDHVVVCGIGRVGYRTVLQLLDVGHEVVAVDSDPSSEFAATIMALKVPFIVGDARDPDVLRSAGVARARGLVVAISDDLKNVEVALTARRRRPELQTVLRIFNRELDRNLERSFGRNSAFGAAALAAPTFAAAAVSREIVHVLSLPEGLLALSEVTVAADSKISGFGTALEQSYGVRMLRLRDASGRERSRQFMSRLEAGDVVLLLGTLAALERVRVDNEAGGKVRFLAPGLSPQRPSERMNTVIVCGLGKVGAAVVRLLASLELQPRLVAVCQSDTSPRVLAELEAQGVPVFLGDARDPAVLEEAGIARAYAVAALSGDDLTNLQVGLTARSIRPEVHLVLRVFSDVLAERLSALFGINTAYSTSALAAPTLAAAAVLREVDHAFDVGERLFVTATVSGGDGLAGRTVAEIRDQTESLVIALRRDGLAYTLPGLEMPIAPGDEAVLLAELKALARLRAQIGGASSALSSPARAPRRAGRPAARAEGD